MHTRYKDAPIAVAARCKGCLNCDFESRWGNGRLCLMSGVLSGTGLCERMITRPDEPYRIWSRSTVRGGHDPELGRSATIKKYIYIHMCVHIDMCVYVCV